MQQNFSDFQFSLEHEAKPDVLELILQTKYGSEGGLRYRHGDMEERIADLHRPDFHVLRKDRRAVGTAAIHCSSGGAVLLVPDHTRESFKPTTGHGGRDGEQRSLRYLQWEWDPDPGDDTYLTDFAYLLREAGGELRIEFERHLCGLFSRETWLATLEQAGFEAAALPFEHSEIEPGACEVFLGRKP